MAPVALHDPGAVGEPAHHHVEQRVDEVGPRVLTQVHPEVLAPRVLDPRQNVVVRVSAHHV